MPLDNYSDLSVGGADVMSGFQFEFRCSQCSQRWRSPFKPYRMGQLTGILTRFAFLFSDVKNAGRASNNFADMGSRGAKDKALAEAMLRAESIYTSCPKCRKAVCGDCFDSSQDLCLGCLKSAADAERHAWEQEATPGALACPSCRKPTSGGRFCGECGFDLASTHKSCPSCSAMATRAARFCTDCGHAF